ncbi:metal-dependent hydrolase [Halapricum desulfuricans]|uniref:Membrane-bound metal-dependent hydrolase YbcI, DUF457 family n=1 Tax=Halapricum desulfuricans TaxID=2841257 RepID=A0A897N7R1_9EURY|nr:metal-dependent hydrolase [Halapricum desulfuricans]QSG10430.1 Membrane-bound metal-dependent hydrolase YbcI, DUF457 family [Halapricum desulfuricans]
MYRYGHYGAALAGYSPLGAVALALGFETAAVGGAVVAVGLAMVPDWDQKVPGIAHRGPTHTVAFASVVAAVLAVASAAIAWASPELGPLVAMGAGLYLGAAGGVTILSHIAADALTPMGVKPFGDGERYSFDVCRADSTLGNYGLLALGVLVAALAYAFGAAVNGLLGL